MVGAKEEMLFFRELQVTDKREDLWEKTDM